MEQQAKTPVVLCILDGLGLRAETDHNAVALAKTPVLDRLFATVPHATLKTCGADVGLPDGQMGNSEVGHMNIGAGRVVWMDLPKINRAIESGDLAHRPALRKMIDALRASGGIAHLMGCFSDGGVHAHIRHLAAAAMTLTEAGIPVALHLFTDGRDVAPQSAINYLEALPEMAGVGIATVTGRFYAMDRDTRWDRIEAAHAAIVEGHGETAPSARAAVLAAYERSETDEFIQPTVIEGYRGMADGDGLLMLNFRADRAREILEAIAAPEFDAFARTRPDFSAVAGMVSYSAQHDAYMDVVFPTEDIADTLAETVTKAGRTQFHLAETEKYPHVTFFLNGGREAPFENEERIVVPSPNVRTYDEQPEMSAPEVTAQLVQAIESRAHDLIVVNYANPDMVGHTGDLSAAIAAVEAVDAGLGQALEALERVGGLALVTADHGNCEMMQDPETGAPHTAHTLNDVPVFLVGARGHALAQGGRLADIAPTLLALMGVPQPNAMTGRSLLEPHAEAAT